jgi:hypothetical protein
MVGQDKRTTCCLCCEKGPVALRTQLERSAYVCGESIKLRASIDNQGEEEVRLKVKLIQVSLIDKNIHKKRSIVNKNYLIGRKKDFFFQHSVFTVSTIAKASK